MRYSFLALLLATPAAAQTGPQISFGPPAGGCRPIMVRDPATGTLQSLGCVPPANGDGKGYYLGWPSFPGVLKGKSSDTAIGTTAIPQQGGGPLVRIAQTENITNVTTQMGGNSVNNEYNSALTVSTTALNGSLGQANALYATAVGAPDNDVVAATFTARRTDNRSRNAYGLYVEARQDGNLSDAIAAELRASNFSGVDSSINPYGQSQTGLIWGTAQGGRVMGPAFAVGNVGDGSKWYAALQGTANSVAQTVVLSHGNPRVVQAIGAHSRGDDYSQATFADAAIALPASGRPQDGIDFGYGIKAYGANDGALHVSSPVNPSEAGTTFAQTGRLYNQADPTHTYARTYTYTAPGNRTTTGVGGVNIALIDPGSGTLSSPDLAGMALTVNAEKANYLGSTVAGELDTLNLGLRNDRGDGSTILANAQGVLRGSGQGTITAWESHTTMVDPVSNTLAQDINIQLGSAESGGVSGGLVGLFAYKSGGTGGKGLFVNSPSNGGTWEYEASLGNRGIEHWLVRAADGGVLHYPANGAAGSQFAMVNDGNSEQMLYNNVSVMRVALAGVTMNQLTVTTSYTPPSSNSSCVAGTIQWDTNYTYICVAANTWKRSALSSF